jgi:hypothetical protein
MVTSDLDFVPNHKVLDHFVTWIEQADFDPKYAKKWGQRYLADPQAAMCEASFWAILTDSGVTVRPNPKDAGPDFVCCKNGVTFYVEATCIKIDRASRQTGMVFTPGEACISRHTQSLNLAILQECKDKTPQCAGLDAPCVLAIGTFHREASALVVRKLHMEWLLLDPAIGFDFDPKIGQLVGESYPVTDLRNSLFTKLTEAGPEHLRHPISSLLVAGLGCGDPRIFGIENPQPIHAFDPTLLDRIAFCSQEIDFRSGTISARWNRPVED